MDEKISIKDLRVGDMVDLQDDKIADPDGNEPAMEFSFQRVEAIEFETPDCIVVYFQDVPAFGFPTDHMFTVDERGPALKDSSDEFDLVTDWSGAFRDAVIVGHEEAFERLKDKLVAGTSAIAMRKSDQSYGIVVRVVETDDIVARAKTRDTKKKADAMSELSEIAIEVTQEHAGVEAWVDFEKGDTGPTITVRAFVSEASYNVDNVEDIALIRAPKVAPTP